MLAKVLVNCVCRRHPTPTREMLEPLLRTAAAVGLNLDVSSSKALADSLDCAVASLFSICSTSSQQAHTRTHNILCFWLNHLIIFQGSDPYFNKLIRILATRCMTQVFDS